MPFVITSTIPETMNIFKFKNWRNKSLSWEGGTFPSLNLMIHADFTPIMQMSLMLPEYLSKKPWRTTRAGKILTLPIPPRTCNIGHVLTVYNHLETNKNVICLLVCINTGCIHLIYYHGCIIN